MARCRTTFSERLLSRSLLKVKDMHTFTGIDVLIDLRKNVTPYAESLAKMIYLDHPDLPGALDRMVCDFLSSMLQMAPRERVSLEVIC